MDEEETPAQIARFGRPESNLLRAGAVRSGSELWPAVARHSCTGSDLHRGERACRFCSRSRCRHGRHWVAVENTFPFAISYHHFCCAAVQIWRAAARPTDKWLVGIVSASHEIGQRIAIAWSDAGGIDGGALGQRVTLGLLPCGITPHDPFVMPPLAGHVGSRLISSGGATDAIRFLGASQA